ncbi:MAG: U32 family peptidase [Spirochaetes bacterium]|nr:U32 family peptidase [Spirochaetota bacterium]
MNEKKRSVPALLAPGGDFTAVKAAVIAGADEIYCGVDRFNARRRATNINIPELRELAQLTAQNGTALFLTVNTLCVENEIAEVSTLVEEALMAGVKALIVQDYGLLHLIRTRFPEVVIHASTQMTTLTSGQIEYLAGCGVSRVNLSRELSLDNIQKLTKFAHELGVETEVFVHGAYCVSYSGQCYMSSFMGGQSGNRGICFQPCRRPYIVGKSSSETYPLSLKDNSAFAYAGELASAGVDSLKIEGRIKGYGYVYNTVSAWRDQLDRISKKERLFDDDPRLHTVFNRSFSAGYLKDRVSAEMFTSRQTDHSLELLAEVVSYHADRKSLTLKMNKTGTSINTGDRVVLYTERNLFICSGIIGELFVKDKYQFTIEHELKGKIERGQLVFRSGREDLLDELTAQIESLNYRPIELSVEVSGSEGAPLQARWSTGEDSFVCETDITLACSRNIPLTKETILTQLSKFSCSGFVLTELDTSNLDNGLFIPLAQINLLRRLAVVYFQNRASRILKTDTPLYNSEKKIRPRDEKMTVLINNYDDLQLINSANYDLSEIFFEVTDPRTFEYREGVIPWFQPIIQEEDMADCVTLLKSLPKEQLVVLNGCTLITCINSLDINWIAGPHFNSVNSLAGELFGNDKAFAGSFASTELNREQIAALAKQACFPLWMIVFGPILLMQSRQCLRQTGVKCKKEMVDESCIGECNRSTVMRNRQGDAFYLVKRPYVSTEIYNSAFFAAPEALKDFKTEPLGFCFDLRSIPYLELTSEQKVAVLESFFGSGNLSQLSSSLKFTSGNYRRGLS